ncbi:AMP-binding protein [Glacieibacterium frigidum]|uniref:ATP-dependent acyl-CoA ligase n=1 Tax=Glacieibacterium frigidum TaxID=2593303 RepID=A0A552U978_9SPHN|nr:AMP-binding protein [Glacieibacterium frigidum]TRW14784.1 ATP-dependent acyl-CoA ligase [Glacieibacterium frigidum]
MSRPITPFEAMDIRSLIDAKTAERGEHPFLIWEPFDGQSQRWSYRDFADSVRRFAAGLQAKGVMPSERVLIHLDNCPEGLIAWLGCAYAGVVPVTTNTRSTESDLIYFAAHSRSVAAITEPQFGDMVRAATPDVAWRAIVSTGEAPESYLPFAAIDGDPESLASRPHDPWAPFGIQYTSGTTARPKAVLWTHANALWGARISAMHEGLRADDVHLTYLPLFHTNAQVYSVLASLWAGAAIVLMPRFSASRFWPVSLRHGATWTSMVPFCAKALLEQPVPPQHSYRFWGNGVGAPAWDAHFGVKTLGWWGMTETITHGVVGTTDMYNTPMAMGRPSPGYTIHIVGEDGRPVQPGAVGDLLVGGVRGLSLFAEYVDDPNATAAAFNAQGMLITGDRVRLGEDGSLFFADRSKDMLKIGGENVAASEIEGAIAAVDGVAEVAVVGMPHPMLDEVPAAFVIPKPGTGDDLADRIAAACRQQLADFKRPHNIRIVESLPRSTLEKIAKTELRKTFDRVQ